MLQNKKYCLLLFVFFSFSNLNGQEKSEKNNIKPNYYNYYSITSTEVERLAKKVQPLVINNSPFKLNIEEVVGDTSKFFSYNRGGSAIGYCGSTKGGIINLLQAPTGVTSHIRFLNEPQKERYVLFYGSGNYMNGLQYNDTSSAIRCYGHVTFNSHNMVMNIMADLFDFEVNEITDSLDVLKLRVANSSKLYFYKKTLKDCWQGGYGGIDTLTNDYMNYCAQLSFLVYTLEHSWNTFIYDETNSGDSEYFTFRIPHELLESIEKLNELNAYLEKNTGLTLKKEKKLEKVYTVRFNNSY